MDKYWLKTTIISLLIIFSGQSFAEEIRDYYSEPGINPFKETLNQNFNESIDPFSGTLQLSYTDIFVPGNGGMDIRVNRSYTSIQTNEYPNRSTYGVGWVMHFGRIVTSKSSILRLCNQNENLAANTLNNPSLEKPDGSREILVFNTFEKNESLITRSNWRAECVDDPDNPGTIMPGMLVTGPDGTKYTMNQYDFFEGEPSWFTTRIEDVHGNWISIEYEETALSELRVKDVYRSEEGAGLRVLRYSYLDVPNEPDKRIVEIEANGQTWQYNYETIVDYHLPRFQLVSVLRPDGKTWGYAYNGKVADPDPGDGEDEDGLGSFSLNQVKYPNGTTIDYTYQYMLFEDLVFKPTTSIETKTVSGGGVDNGTTTYLFEPQSVPHNFISAATGNTIVLNLDKTTVTTPHARYEYFHNGKAFSSTDDGNGNLTFEYISPELVGLLRKKATYDLSGNLKQIEHKSWGHRVISLEDYSRGSSRSWWTQDDTTAPYLLSEGSASDSYADIDSGLVTKKVDYSDYDDYGNAETISEHDSTNSITGDKITTLTYTNDIQNWILGLNTSEHVEHDGVIADTTRLYVPGTPLLEEENKYGVVTKYTYTTNGDLASVEDARGNITTYSDYKRGIARQENQPEAINIIRTVNDTGSLASETDGRGYVKSYTYDDLNRLTGITYPINQPVSITYPGNTRVLTRGDYQQTDTFDGLGQRISTERVDLNTSQSITQTLEYDASGRVEFESYPNSTDADGLNYQYDALNRQTRKTHPDGNFIQYVFDDYFVTETDERNNSTTYVYRNIGLASREIGQINQPESITTVINRNFLGQITKIHQGELQTNNTVTGFSRTFEYDEHFFLKSKTDLEIGTTTYERDEVGNTKSSRTEDSEVTNYVYDGLNRITDIDYPEGTDDIAYVYDNNSNIEKLTSGITEWNYIYDENNNLKQESLSINALLPRTYTLDYQYDGLDTRESTTYPGDLVVDYAPDALGRATKVGDFASNVVFHPAGQLNSLTLGDTAETQIKHTFNNRMFPESITSSGSLVDLTYSYDPVGNVTSIVDAIDAAQNITMNAANSYDGVDRLKNASGAWGNSSFNYDERGNFTSKTIGSQTFSYEFRQEKLIAMNDDSLHLNFFDYDVYGNIIGKTDYDPAGDLVAKINERKVFKYDDASRLIESEVSDDIKHYTYDGNNQQTVNQEPGSYDLSYSVYSSDGQLMFEESMLECKKTTYIRLGSLLLARSDDKPADVSLDDDNDNIIDCLELLVGLDPTISADANADADGDGLSNILEIENGTSLSSNDTDEDGVTDNNEILAGLNPGDVDSDGDGLSDSDESVHPGLDLLVADTDHDGVNDGLEISAGLDPLNPADGKEDLDVDGFSNRQEAMSGTEIAIAVSTPQQGNVLWHFQTGMSIDGNAVVDEDGVIYVASRDSKLYAIYPDGTEKWTYTTNNSITSAPALGADGTVYITDTNTIYAIGSDGILIDSLGSIGNVQNKSPAIGSDGTIYVVSSNDVYAINPDLSIKWQTPHDNFNSYSSPAIAIDGTIYFGSYSFAGIVNYLNAYDSEGNLKWRYATETSGDTSTADIESSPAIGREGTVYITTNDGVLHAVSPAGELKWSRKYETGSATHTTRYRSPVIGQNGEIYLGAYGSKILAYDSQGEPLWDYDTVASTFTPTLGADGTVYANGFNGVVYAINSLGELKWEKDLGFTMRSPIALDTDGTLYVTSSNGRLYSLADDNPGGLAKSPWPKFQHDLSASGNQCRIEGGYSSNVVDTDGDDIPDCHEIVRNLNPDDPTDGALDPDQDGLTNSEEYLNGTLMLVADSDGDDLNDGDEVNVHNRMALS